MAWFLPFSSYSSHPSVPNISLRILFCADGTFSKRVLPLCSFVILKKICGSFSHPYLVLQEFPFQALVSDLSVAFPKICLTSSGHSLYPSYHAVVPHNCFLLVNMFPCCFFFFLSFDVARLFISLAPFSFSFFFLFPKMRATLPFQTQQHRLPDKPLSDHSAYPKRG